MVGRRITVYWPDEGERFAGTVMSYCAKEGKVGAAGSWGGIGRLKHLVHVRGRHHAQTVTAWPHSSLFWLFTRTLQPFDTLCNRNPVTRPLSSHFFSPALSPASHPSPAFHPTLPPALLPPGRPAVPRLLR